MDSNLDKYIENHTSKEDTLLSELDRETHLKVVQPRMLSGNVQGKLLKLFVQMSSPKSILEIGTFTGYSALCMASGLEDAAIIDTIEVDDELEGIAQSFFKRSEFSDKIKHHIGSALDIAPKLEKCFDLVFVDGDKREYPEYYKMLMGDAPYTTPLVKSGSIIMADNILWYGKVVEPIHHNDKFTMGIVEFNSMVQNDDRVENVILPVRDGINMIRVK